VEEEQQPRTSLLVKVHNWKMEDIRA